MNAGEEKKIIYELMREILTERRILSQQYFELKEKLSKLGTIETTTKTNERNSVVETSNNEEKKSKFAKEKLIQDDFYHRNNKSGHFVSFDRISKNIVFILKQSDVPLSNKELYERLTSEFEMVTSYSNLTCNILPRMHKDSSINVERAYRGFWQYRKQ